MNAILIDANILCVVVAGLYCPDQLGVHKKLKAYSADDFELILKIGNGFSRVLTCAHILTECSNLLASSESYHQKRLLGALAEWVKGVTEEGVDAITATNQPEYLRLGLTDSVINILCQTGATLLSADAMLCIAVAKRGLNVINYNHVRDGAAPL